MNRFFTAPELVTEYRLPKHVQEQLLANVAPVQKTDRGEPLFLVAYVDAWLSDQYAAVPERRAGEDFLTIREVVQLLRCSYTEARDRMLDSRIRTIKDGRWLRTRREWVEQYVAAKTIKLPDPELVELPRPRGKRHVKGSNQAEDYAHLQSSDSPATPILVGGTGSLLMCSVHQYKLSRWRRST